MNAAFEDIERTLSGCDYDASSVSIRLMCSICYFKFVSDS